MSTAEQKRARREYLISRKRCVQCAGQDAYTLNGRRLCAECTAKSYACNKAYREAHRDLLRKRYRDIRAKRKAAGLCISCGRANDRDGRAECSFCAEKRRRKRIQRVGTAFPRGSDGLCWQCHHQEAEPDKKLCADCYQRLAERNRRMSAAVHSAPGYREAHPWTK